MENLGFYILLGWKMVIIPMVTISLIHFSLKLRVNVLFELGSERVIQNRQLAPGSEVPWISGLEPGYQLATNERPSGGARLQVRCQKQKRTCILVPRLFREKSLGTRMAYMLPFSQPRPCGFRTTRHYNSPFTPKFKKYILSTFQRKMYSEVVRTGSIIIFPLNKLWKAKFSLLCDVIFLVRLQEKFEIDRLLGVKGVKQPWEPYSRTVREGGPLGRKVKRQIFSIKGGFSVCGSGNARVSFVKLIRDFPPFKKCLSTYHLRSQKEECFCNETERLNAGAEWTAHRILNRILLLGSQSDTEWISGPGRCKLSAPSSRRIVPNETLPCLDFIRTKRKLNHFFFPVCFRRTRIENRRCRRSFCVGGVRVFAAFARVFSWESKRKFPTNSGPDFFTSELVRDSNFRPCGDERKCSSLLFSWHHGFSALFLCLNTCQRGSQNVFDSSWY